MSCAITNNDINKARGLIYDICQIHLPASKDSTIRNRLEKLAREFHIDDFAIFFRGVETGVYRQDFINAFTTNKTDFFREGFHFLDMMDRVLPHSLKKSEPFKVFCSASSTGEEPYSIAATLLHAKEVYRSNTLVDIIATDIDTSVLEVAKKGEYLIDTLINPLPTWLTLSDFFEMKKDSAREVSLKAKRCLKEIITYKQLNLCNAMYPFSENEFDIIFCRNVLIYFKVEDQKEILRKLTSCLKVEGTLYLGHSEGILDLAGKYDRLGQNIFVKISD